MLRQREGKVISKKTVRKILGKTEKVTFKTKARTTRHPSSAKNTEEIQGTDKMLLLKVKEISRVGFECKLLLHRAHTKSTQVSHSLFHERS